MDYQVRMTAAYAPPRTREVSVPAEELTGVLERDLDLIFKYGQNDFQPQARICSVSIADVIEFNDLLYMVLPTGFQEISPLEYEEFIALPLEKRRIALLGG